MSVTAPTAIITVPRTDRTTSGEMREANRRDGRRRVRVVLVRTLVGRVGVVRLRVAKP